MRVIRQAPSKDGKRHVIEYTEEIAGMFRGMFETLFRLNEQLAGGLTPDKIRVLAAGQSKLLLPGGTEE